MSSFLGEDKSVRYYTKTMKTNAVECWIGAYNVGYLPTNVDIEMLIPVSENKVIFADEKGNWFHSAVTEGVSCRNKV